MMLAKLSALLKQDMELMESKLLEKLEVITIDQRLVSGWKSRESMMLVTRFLGGLKDEIRFAVVVQLDTLQQAVAIALKQETVLAEKATKTKGKFVNPKPDFGAETTPARSDKGDLWKSR
uniref:Uncharacterized protein n=1 Tax=Oryza meridionalis TaxID=40149 RepID=A0A0E0DPQ6_9ORYZ